MYKFENKARYSLGYYEEAIVSTLKAAAAQNRAVRISYEDKNGDRTQRRILPLEVTTTTTTRQATLKAIDLEKNAPRYFTLQNIWFADLADELPESEGDVAVQMLQNTLLVLAVDITRYRFEVTYNKDSYATVGVSATLDTNEFIKFTTRIKKTDLDRESSASLLQIEY